MRVLDHDHDGRGGRDLAQHVERGERDQEEVRRLALGHAERGEHRVALRRGERVEVVEHRPNSSWCRPANGSRASDCTPVVRSTRIPRAAGRRGGGVQQRGLPDPGLAAQHETAAALGQHGQQIMQAPELPRTSDQAHRPESWRAGHGR